MPEAAITFIASAGFQTGSALIGGTTLANIGFSTVIRKAIFTAFAAGILASLNRRQIGALGESPAAPLQSLTSSAALRRYVFGRSRVAGAVVYAEEKRTAREGEGDDYNDLILVYVVSEGRCHALNAVYINNVRVPLEDDGSGILRPVNDNRYRPFISLYAAFRADGSEGARVNDLGATDTAWSPSDQLKGVSFVAVRLRHAWRPNAENEFWDSIPQLSFEMQGIRIVHPRSSGQAVWTENTAAIYYWYLTERRGLDASAIDLTTWKQAYSVCEQSISLPLQQRYFDAGYEMTFPRYTAGGVINSGESPQAVQDQLNLAMHGDVVFWNGKYRFYAGAGRTHSRIMSKDDIVEVSERNVVPPLTERFNCPSAQMAATLDTQFNETSMECPTDHHIVRQLVERDAGRLYQRDLGSFRFINRIGQGWRLVISALHEARDLRGYTMKFHRGENFENLTIAPGDIIRVSDPVGGLTDATMQVERVSVDTDHTITCSLTTYNAAILDRSYELPPFIPQLITGLPRAGVPGTTPGSGINNASESIIAPFGRNEFGNPITPWGLREQTPAQQAITAEFGLQDRDVPTNVYGTTANSDGSVSVNAPYGYFLGAIPRVAPGLRQFAPYDYEGAESERSRSPRVEFGSVAWRGRAIPQSADAELEGFYKNYVSNKRIRTLAEFNATSNTCSAGVRLGFVRTVNTHRVDGDADNNEWVSFAGITGCRQ